MINNIKNIKTFISKNNLPFSEGDITAGCENEFQTVVIGDRNSVDLPISIEKSSYLSNIKKRILSGEVDTKDNPQLEKFISENVDGIWEHSWVRFPLNTLSSPALETLDFDLSLDKSNKSAGKRADISNFFFEHNNEKWLRIPVSYLLKLSLVDIIGTQELMPEILKNFGSAILKNFLNDNISPEVFSFSVTHASSTDILGTELSKETSLRFLLIQLISRYAEIKFKLQENNQKILIYFSPQPPFRLRKLNELISDSYYMDLFINPCLSGWDRGEEKYNYMLLCHQSLSRSQLNCISKLKDAGIVTNNLVVLPNTSNISLANNGTHISIGSMQLTDMMKNDTNGFANKTEKYYGDLVIKFVEHFLPLFVGTYTAAPYRIDFTDFHPEKILGFLPHELDYTHLRMLWRRWKTKAHLKIFNKTFTPFGPNSLDKFISRIFRLKGDFVPDFRTIDYLVALLSTNTTPALDGKPGNLDKLKKDLALMGIFDAKMSPYLLYRLREFNKMGFSGFEGRFYSLFENLGKDMSKAVEFQILLTHLAFMLISKDKLRHDFIPDDPTTESERRQVFFASAIGIPTIYIRKETPNVLLKEIMSFAQNTRSSRRYPGYTRIPLFELKKALLAYLKKTSFENIDPSIYVETLSDLHSRLDEKSYKNVASRITREITSSLNKKDPLSVKSHIFNKSIEDYYRNDLRIKYIEESIAYLKDEIKLLKKNSENNPNLKNAVSFVLGNNEQEKFIDTAFKDFLSEKIPFEALIRLINLTILSLKNLEIKSNNSLVQKGDNNAAPVYRAGNW